MADLEDTIAQTEFTCPRCGGHEWGTYFEDGAFNPADINAGNGLCHGTVVTTRSRTVCRFTWPRRDDAKYFRPTGRFYPRTCVGTVL